MAKIEFEMEGLKQEMLKSVETVQKMNTLFETNVDILSKKQEVIDGQIEQLSEEVKQKLQTELASFKDQPDQGVDGGWSAWGQWSECSASCGSGMESRYRSCSNPKPSKGGDHCYGDSTEYRLCSKLACTDVHVGFTVYKANSSSGTNSPLKFQSTLFNSDDSFNTSTGIFTCIYSGLYFFSATVMRNATSTSAKGEYSCYFMVNDIYQIRVFANDNSNSASYPGSSASIVLRLNKNDRVNLGNCNDASTMYYPGVSFTGFRISP